MLLISIILLNENILYILELLKININLQIIYINYYVYILIFQYNL